MNSLLPSMKSCTAAALLLIMLITVECSDAVTLVKTQRWYTQWLQRQLPLTLQMLGLNVSTALHNSNIAPDHQGLECMIERELEKTQAYTANFHCWCAKMCGVGIQQHA